MEELIKMLIDGGIRSVITIVLIFGLGSLIASAICRSMEYTELTEEELDELRKED